MLTSIILVSFNSRDYLQGCLDSLHKTLPEDCEILLLDNASSDGGADLVETDYPDVHLIRGRINLGYAGGNNRAADLARGDILVFINPDTYFEPGWLEALLVPIQTNPKVGLTTSKILLMNVPNKINTCGNDIHLSGLTLCRGAELGSQELDKPVEVSAISGAAFAIRRDLFERLGGFDKDFFLYMEDSDLSWRARLVGQLCLYTPQSVVYHDYKLCFGPRKTFFQERNRYLMLLKNLHWGSLIALFPVWLVAELVTWGYILLCQRDQWKQKLEVYAWIPRNWDLVREKRKQTQHLRKRRDRDILHLHTWRLDYKQTGSGLAASLAHILIDPLFWGLYGVARLVIWW